METELTEVLIDEDDLKRLFKDNPKLKAEKNYLYFIDEDLTGEKQEEFCN